MTSRPVPNGEPGAAGRTPVKGPGARPHLPPVASSTTTTSRRTDRKTPLGWLPWLLLGLLALTLLGTALLAKAAGGGGSSADADAASGDRSSATQGGSSDGAQASGGGAAAAGSGAALTAGGKDVLAASGNLSGLEGQKASGTATVESVVADEGFWVGRDATQRVFVFLTPEARRSAGESGFQVTAGQTVSLQGTVKASSDELARSSGVSDAEGAAQLVKQGGYIEATEVSLAG